MNKKETIKILVWNCCLNLVYSLTKITPVYFRRGRWRGRGRRWRWRGRIIVLCLKLFLIQKCITTIIPFKSSEPSPNIDTKSSFTFSKVFTRAALVLRSYDIYKAIRKYTHTHIIWMMRKGPLQHIRREQPGQLQKEGSNQQIKNAKKTLPIFLFWLILVGLCYSNT